MKPLKIALVVDHFLPRIGGIELHVSDLAEELKKHGHEPHVITGTPGDALCGRIPIHRLDSPLMPGFKIIYRPKALRKLEAILQREKFDVLHAHSSVVSPLAYGAFYLGRCHSLPRVLTCHSLLETSIYTFRVLDKLFRFSEAPAVLTAVSGAAAESVQRIAKNHAVGILPNGVRLEEWENAPVPKGGVITITSVLRLNKKKRAQDLIHAIPAILKKLPPGRQPRFILIGKGPYQNILKAIISRLQLTDRVQLTGYLTRREIRQIFSQTDLFVLPTIKEAFGIALLEARSAGLPVVAMNHGGTSDIVEHGKQGFLAQNQQELVSFVVRLIQDEELRRRMAKDAPVGLEKYSWNHVIEQHLQYYRQAIHHLEKRAS